MFYDFYISELDGDEKDYIRIVKPPIDPKRKMHLNQYESGLGYNEDTEEPEERETTTTPLGLDPTGSLNLGGYVDDIATYYSLYAKYEAKGQYLFCHGKSEKFYKVKILDFDGDYKGDGAVIQILLEVVEEVI